MAGKEKGREKINFNKLRATCVKNIDVTHTHLPNTHQCGGWVWILPIPVRGRGYNQILGGVANFDQNLNDHLGGDLGEILQLICRMVLY